MSPKRIQLKRTKGWRKPEGAIVVTRPGRWGNPFKVGETIDRNDDRFKVLADLQPAIAGLSAVRILTADIAVDAYFHFILNAPRLWLAAGDELAGHDLACWCPLVDEHGEKVPCHADVLLEVANR